MPNDSSVAAPRWRWLRSLRVALPLLAGVLVLLIAAAAAGQGDVEGDGAAAVTADTTVQAQISELNRRLLQNPRDGKLYNNLGVLYAGQEEWILARDAFIAAVQADPFEADFHRNLGSVFVRLENFDLAVREFQAYRKFDLLGAADHWRLIAEAWRAAGKPDSARVVFQEGITTLAPELGEEGMTLVLALTRLYQEADQPDQGRALLEEHVAFAGRVLAEAAADSQAAAPNSSLATQPAQAIVNNLLAIYLDDAQLLQQSDLPAAAAGLYEKALALAPARADILPPLVDAYLAADEKIQAKVVARRARNDFPEAPGTWIATGKIAEWENYHQDALTAYLKARELGYEQVDLDLKIGDLYMKLGDSSAARNYLAAGISAPDAPAEVIYNYAVCLVREKKYDLAVRPLRRAVERRPDLAAAWQALALCLRLGQRYEEAIPAYEMAITFESDPKLWFNLALCQSRADQIDAAVDSYRQAIALEPGFKEAHYNLGRLLMSAGRYEEALVAMDANLAVEPDSYRIFFNQGVCLFSLDRPEEAILKYELALEQKETADVLNNLGLAYDKLGKKEIAQSFYKEAKKLKGEG